MQTNNRLELDAVSADVTLAAATQGPLLYGLLDPVSKTVVRIWLQAPGEAGRVAIPGSGMTHSDGN